MAVGRTQFFKQMADFSGSHQLRPAAIFPARNTLSPYITAGKQSE
jgi:hypothetical protein